MKINEKLRSLQTRTVKLYINDDSDLFSRYSLNTERDPDSKIDLAAASPSDINRELIEYLEKEAAVLPRIIGMNIDLCAKGRTQEELALIADLIKTELKRKYFRLHVTSIKTRWHSVILVLGSIIPLMVQHFFSTMVSHFAISEFLLVVAWVFMWKAVELFFFEHSEIMKEKKSLKKILRAEIFS